MRKGKLISSLMLSAVMLFSIVVLPTSSLSVVDTAYALGDSYTVDENVVFTAQAEEAEEPEPEPVATPSEAAKTGDTANIPGLIALVVVSLTTFIGALLLMRREDKKSLE